MVTNTAGATFQTPVGTDSVVSNTVQTVVVRVQASLQMALMGPRNARVGEAVTYRIVYSNLSTNVPIVGAVLINSLPVGLDFVSAQPAPTVSNRVLQWSLGELPVGSSAQVLLTLRVADGVRDTLRIRNSAVLASANADSVVSEAEVVTLTGNASKGLALTKSAGQLEVGIGENAPFTLVVQNTGSQSLADLVVHDLLPEGSRYARGSATGVDSARATGRHVEFFLAGALAPGARTSVHYNIAVVSAATPSLRNTAYATADGASVRSPDAVALLRVRRGFAMENRVAIGKVWVDLNGNGVQDVGEPGVADAEVWTDDGEIAITDADGRFSYRNLRPGQHGFRLDPASLPAEFALAGSPATRDLVTRDASGWTTPNVNFRLLAKRGRLTAVRPIGWGGDRPRDNGDQRSTPPQSKSLFRPASHAVAIDRPLAANASAPNAVAPAIATDRLPDPAVVPPGGEVEITIDPPSAGWPGEASFPLPAGWTVAATAARGVTSPRMGRDRSGTPMLLWQLSGQTKTPLLVRLRPSRATRPFDTVRVPILRSSASREAEKQRAFLDGAPVTFFSPQDGQTLTSDRVFVGVRGEPGAAVALFDGDSLIERAAIRPDGVHDFIAVALRPGPHRLRVRMQNTSQREMWDSTAVHVTGQPARFVAEVSRITLVADGNTIAPARVRVLDQWGVPVTNRPEITVAATGAEPVNVDANPSSLGVQITPDEAGWLTVQLRSGRMVTRGSLLLEWARVRQELPLDVLPANGPLFLTAVGRVGVGASPDAFGAMTARGQLSKRTSLVATYDSRRLDAGRDMFGRNADPLEQTQYPILGDASAQRTTSASRYQLAARVERGFDWLSAGDISTSGFASGLTLSGYRRALPGIAGRVSTGAVVWQGFGSSTSQLLQQLQVRGAGISGPYVLKQNIRGGTEQVVLEIRALENATRVVSRQVMERYVDYQIDYDAGTLLFKQAVPATDVYGNPVFVVVLYEAESGGPKSEVWGVRGTLDASRWLKSTRLDSTLMGVTWVNESRLAGGHQLLGSDLRMLRLGALELNGETSMSRSGDSSGVAARVNSTLTLFRGAALLSGTWLAAGREFANPANAAIQGGTQELRLAAELRNGGRRLRFTHERQQFSALGLERSQTVGTMIQPLGPAAQLQAAVTRERFTGTTLSNSALGAEAKLQWAPTTRLTLFSEGRQQFAAVGANPQPSYVGAGANLAVAQDVTLELRHRQVFLSGDSGSYSVTDVGVRTRIGAGTEAYSKYQIAGVGGAHNAALVGLRNRLKLGDAGALNVQFERRNGLGRALAIDPVRALPFLQNEEDYWSMGLGAEFFRPGAPYRLSARAEYRDGDIRSTRLMTAAGDVSIRRSLALLSRQELLRNHQVLGGGVLRGHRYSTLWGLALRPVQSNALNLLGKVEWIDEDKGVAGGALTGPKSEGRGIAAGEAVWQPLRGSEVALRYAYRQATGSVTTMDGMTLQPRSQAHFVGWRASRSITRLLEARAEGRLVASGARAYDVAPALAVFPQQTVEVVAGYRVGQLRDPDFAVNGGRGWFVTFGARVTEGSMTSAAEFWRQRLGGR